MGTITIQASGFSPGPNGSRSTNQITEVDYARLILWARNITVTPGAVDVRTDGQVLSDFVAREWQTWKDAIQAFERAPSTNPTPIDIS